MKKDANETLPEPVITCVPPEGTKLKVVIPIDIAEDLRWEVGREVEIVRAYEDGAEVEDSDGVVASFALQDIRGDGRWFDLVRPF